MTRTIRDINRRSFLQGGGAAIALPFLESRAFADSNVESTDLESSPRRMVCIGLEYGLHPEDFFPEKTGRLGDELPTLLAPLSSLKQEFTVLSGLDHPGVSGGHYVTHTFLSGIKSSQAKSHPEGNITVDQKAAEFVGAKTRFPSMQLGIGGGGVSWTRNGVSIPAIEDLQVFFDALFQETPESKKQRMSESFEVNRSILDLVRDDAGDLKRRISRNDLDKLDEYFTSIREVEKQLTQSETWLNKPKPKTDYKLPKSLPNDFYGEVPLFYQLMKLALQTDSTRVLSLFIKGWKGNSGLPGVNKGYHDLTHHGRDPNKLRQLSIVESFHTTEFAKFAEGLKQTQASQEESLLDKTMLLFGSGLGNAASHSNRNLPMILAGGGFSHGEHKSYANEKGESTPACNLFVSMLQRMGMHVEQFGTSTGSLGGLG